MGVMVQTAECGRTKWSSHLSDDFSRRRHSAPAEPNQGPSAYWRYGIHCAAPALHKDITRIRDYWIPTNRPMRGLP